MEGGGKVREGRGERKMKKPRGKGENVMSG